MCGIAGSIGERPTSNLTNIFSSIMKETEVRGHHATGVASLTSKASLYFKLGAPASEFIRTKGYRKVVTDDSKILLGHCRYATCGDPAVNANNHPFVSKSGRFIFAHNGKVGSLDKLQSSGLKVEIESATDSEYILRAIEALVAKGMSVTKAIKESVYLFPKAEFACILIDTYYQTLYVWRNYMRPLWIWDCTNLTGTHMVTSTKTIFRKSLMACGYTQAQIDKIKGYQLSPYMVYFITLDGCISLSQIPESSLGFKILKPEKKPPFQGGKGFRSATEALAYLDALSTKVQQEADNVTRRTFGTDIYEDGAYLSDDDAPFDTDSSIDELFSAAMDDLSALGSTDSLDDLLKDLDDSKEE